MIEYFKDQLKVMNSDQQLLQYMYYDGELLFSGITVHPFYSELKGMTFLEFKEGLPVFKEIDHE